MISDQRKNEVWKQFIFDGDASDGALHCLTIQELLFLTASCVKFAEEKQVPFEGIDYENKISMFNRIVLEKVKAGHELYIAYDDITKQPHIDNGGFGWIFSEKEFADAAIAYYKEQEILLTIKRVRGEEVLQAFADFYRIGLENLLLDNGQFRLNLKRSDIIAPPDYADIPQTQIPVMNPETQMAIIQFFQNAYSKNNFERKNEFVNGLEARMLQQILQSKFLLPMKLEEKDKAEADVNGIKQLKKGTGIEFATLIDNQTQTAWVPAFTDWEETCKIYSKAEWTCNIVSYDELVFLSQKMEGVVVNPAGVPLRIHKKNMERIEAFRAEWNKALKDK